MKLIEIQENQSKQWDEFVKNSSSSAMQQDRSWGKFQESNNRKTYYLALKKGKKTLLQAIIVKHPLPFGKAYFYIPRGPIVAKNNTVGNARERSLQIRSVLNEFFNQLGLFARKENAIFVRFDPAIEKSNKLASELTKNYYNTSGSIHQPENTLVLDLTKDGETLLKEMKSKTRYNIRLAKRKGVTIKQVENKKDLEDFLKLNQETTERDKFQGHEDDYYKKLLDFFKNDSEVQLKLFLAEYKNKPIAAIIISFYNQTATYLHGASGNEHRNLMAPHLLQWAGIKIAKKLGFKKYDFFGIAPNDQPNHPWSGITRFKKGFGGEEINYVPTREFVYNKLWYQLMKIGKKFK